MTSHTLQLTSLRSFVPRFAAPQRRCLSCRRPAAAASPSSGTVELLRGARPLEVAQPPAAGLAASAAEEPGTDAGGVPPYPEWHQHAELLQGWVECLKQRAAPTLCLCRPPPASACAARPTLPLAVASLARSCCCHPCAHAAGRRALYMQHALPAAGASPARRARCAWPCC